MPRRRNSDLEKIRASLDVTCPHCSARIAPEEQKRVDWDHIRCPRCQQQSLSQVRIEGRRVDLCWRKYGCNLGASIVSNAESKAKPTSNLVVVITWFGTRGSEVQILSPRPIHLKHLRHIEPDPSWVQWVYLAISVPPWACGNQGQLSPL